MRSTSRSSLAFLVVGLLACGGGGAGDGGGPPVVDPPVEDPPPLSGEPVLAPLAAGTRWTYTVTDPLRGTFEKDVQVIGSEQVPDSTARAMRVRDLEPSQEETSWLEVRGGYLLRHREEDRKAGALVRATTWSPAAPKALAASAPAGFSADVSVRESEWLATTGATAEKVQIYRFTVVAVGVQVTVPAGTFTCLQVDRLRVDKLEPKRTYWLAPGVGKVREEGERVEQLTAFTPGT